VLLFRFTPWRPTWRDSTSSCSVVFLLASKAEKRALCPPEKLKASSRTWPSRPAASTHGELTALLWGDSAEGQARHSFRQALASLRRALGQGEPAVLLTQEGTIALIPRPWRWTWPIWRELWPRGARKDSRARPRCTEATFSKLQRR